MESPPVVPETSKSPDGLTALHLAVIHNDHPRVRELLSSGEYGVDARSAKGTTPLMLTCLFGRYNIFLALIRKKASLKKQDTNGLGVMEYIRQLSLTHDMLKRYQAFTGQQPSIKGRQSVFSILRLCIHARNQKQHDSQVLHGSHNHRDEEAEIRPEANVRSAAPATVPADSDTIFLRDGKELKIVEVRTLARAEFNIDVGRKSSGGIRAKGEQHFMKMAISGWGGAHGHGALNNETYSALVRQVCRVYSFRLEGNWLDHRFNGDPSDQVGAFVSCHIEKQLGVWILEEALSHVLHTRALTLENIALLKGKIDRVPSVLRHTVVELDHKPCASCIDFLGLIQVEAGLEIDWQPRKWFAPGTRPSLRVLDGALVVGRAGEQEIFVDEIGEWDLISKENAVAPDDDDFVIVEDTLSPPSSPLGSVHDEEWMTIEELSSPAETSRQQKDEQRSHQSRGKPSCPKHVASPIMEWPPKDSAVLSKALPNVPSRRQSRAKGDIKRIPRLDSNNLAIVLPSSPRDEVIEPFPRSQAWVQEQHSSQSQEDQE